MEAQTAESKREARKRTGVSDWDPRNTRIPRYSEPAGLSGCSVPGHARTRLEAVLEDLAVQRSAADLEHARRFLLVPRDRFEHTQDVGPLGLGQRRHARRLGRGG